jgi:hypothetical protein
MTSRSPVEEYRTGPDYHPRQQGLEKHAEHRLFSVGMGAKIPRGVWFQKPAIDTTGFTTKCNKGLAAVSGFRENGAGQTITNSSLIGINTVNALSQ